MTDRNQRRRYPQLAPDFYIFKGLWGYSILPQGRPGQRISTKVYNTIQEALEAFAKGERPIIEKKGDSHD